MKEFDWSLIGGEIVVQGDEIVKEFSFEQIEMGATNSNSNYFYQSSPLQDEHYDVVIIELDETPGFISNIAETTPKRKKNVVTPSQKRKKLTNFGKFLQIIIICKSYTIHAKVLIFINMGLKVYL